MRSLLFYLSTVLSAFLLVSTPFDLSAQEDTATKEITVEQPAKVVRPVKAEKAPEPSIKVSTKPSAKARKRRKATPPKNTAQVKQAVEIPEKPPKIVAPAPVPPPSTPKTEKPQTQNAPDAEWTVIEHLFPQRTRDPSVLVLLVLLLVLNTLLLFIIKPLRRSLSREGLLHSILRVITTVLRITALALAAGIVVQIIPASASAILWLVVLAAGAAFGWSMRDILPDLIAGVVLIFERRIRNGMWVSGEGFQGTVERRGLRATWLRDGQGHLLGVPNRTIMGAPIVYDTTGEAEYEVIIRLGNIDENTNVRQALHDAVLASPWVLAGSIPIVLRDPADPVVWRVRSSLLEPRFAAKFEGELLERVEDLLHYNARETRPDPIEEERATRPEIAASENGDEPNSQQ